MPRVSVPPAAKRPFWLPLALAVALLFGVGSWVQGCETMAYYKVETVDAKVFSDGVTDPVERATLEGLVQRLFDVRDAARTRALPLGIAAFVLGTAMITLTARTFGRRAGARVGLAQVVLVQGALTIATHFLTADVRVAERELQLGAQVARTKVAAPEHAIGESDVALMRNLLRAAAPAWLVFRSLAACLVVIALTRPRAREFLDPPGGPPMGDALEP